MPKGYYTDSKLLLGWKYYMIQTQRLVDLGGSTLTLTSLRSELLHVEVLRHVNLGGTTLNFSSRGSKLRHGTSLERCEQRVSLTYSLRAYITPSLHSLRYYAFRSDFLVSDQTTKNSANFFTHETITC